MFVSELRYESFYIPGESEDFSSLCIYSTASTFDILNLLYIYHEEHLLFAETLNDKNAILRLSNASKYVFNCAFFVEISGKITVNFQKFLNFFS